MNKEIFIYKETTCVCVFVYTPCEKMINLDAGVDYIIRGKSRLDAGRSIVAVCLNADINSSCWWGARRRSSSSPPPPPPGNINPTSTLIDV